MTVFLKFIFCHVANFNYVIIVCYVFEMFTAEFFGTFQATENQCNDIFVNFDYSSGLIIGIFFVGNSYDSVIGSYQ